MHGPLEGLHMLVVDDDPDLRDVLIDALRRRGAKVDAAAGGNEAIGLLARTCYDFVLSDVRMPDGDGLSLARAMAAIPGPRPPLALHSGFNDVSEAECRRLGILRVIHKPTPITEIVAFVRSSCGRGS